MPKRPKVKETHLIGIRLEIETVRELMSMAAKLSRPGVTYSTNDAMRAAIAEGLKVLKRERGRTKA